MVNQTKASFNESLMDYQTIVELAITVNLVANLMDLDLYFLQKHPICCQFVAREFLILFIVTITVTARFVLIKAIIAIPIAILVTMLFFLEVFYRNFFFLQSWHFDFLANSLSQQALSNLVFFPLKNSVHVTLILEYVIF